jgi:hypothetical protein
VKMRCRRTCIATVPRKANQLAGSHNHAPSNHGS